MHSYCYLFINFSYIEFCWIWNYVIWKSYHSPFPKLHDQARFWVEENHEPTLLSPKYVTIDITGAANAKTSKCFLIRFRSSPACIRKETRPKAAGACKKQYLLLIQYLLNPPEKWEKVEIWLTPLKWTELKTFRASTSMLQLTQIKSILKAAPL